MHVTPLGNISQYLLEPARSRAGRMYGALTTSYAKLMDLRSRQQRHGGTCVVVTSTKVKPVFPGCNRRSHDLTHSENGHQREPPHLHINMSVCPSVRLDRIIFHSLAHMSVFYHTLALSVDGLYILALVTLKALW